MYHHGERVAQPWSAAAPVGHTASRQHDSHCVDLLRQASTPRQSPNAAIIASIFADALLAPDGEAAAGRGFAAFEDLRGVDAGMAFTPLGAWRADGRRDYTTIEAWRA